MLLNSSLLQRSLHRCVSLSDDAGSHRGSLFSNLYSAPRTSDDKATEVMPSKFVIVQPSSLTATKPISIILLSGQRGACSAIL